MQTTAPIRTAHELDELKRQWLLDPAWDIEDTEGFEAHRAELHHFRTAREALARKTERQRLQAKAQRLGCAVPLVEYIERLERHVTELENFHRAAYNGETTPTPHYIERGR